MAPAPAVEERVRVGDRAVDEQIGAAVAARELCAVRATVEVEAPGPASAEPVEASEPGSVCVARA